MSRKGPSNLVPAPLDLPETSAIHTGSDNLCSVKRTLCDSSLLLDGRVRCPACGREFRPETPKQTYCDLTCYWEAQRRAPIEPRFWQKVNKNGPIPIHCPELGNCWLWTASTTRGYGQFTFRNPDGTQEHVYAHRFSYELTNGPLPSPAIKACHRCDQRLCVRASHLFAGTQADNLDDARRKGRLIDGAHLIKVDDAGITDILRNYRPRHNGKQLAQKYGITLVSLLRIVNGTQRVQRRYVPPPALDPVQPVTERDDLVHHIQQQRRGAAV